MTPVAADLNRLLRLMILSVTSPRDAAGVLMATNLSRAILWQSLVLVTVLSVLLVALTQGPMPELPVGATTPISVTPYAYAVILGSSLVMLVFAVHFTGQALGGTGDFGSTLILVIWIEVLGMALRMIQTIVLLVNPYVASLFSVLGFGLLCWVLLSFVNALHRFDSMWKALFTLVLAVIGISIGITLILTLIGVSLSGGGMDV